MIWNRDRGLCQSPECIRPDRRVAFREANVHHITEHSAGGKTTLRNGILICPECHTNRADMQRLTKHFQDYISRVYDSPQQFATDSLFEDTIFEREAEENWDTNREGIKIVIDWGALDIDRETQTIRKANDADTIVELLRLLLETFKKPIRDQLVELPIVRFPLSTNPMRDFLNRSQNRPYSYTQIPGTDLFFAHIRSDHKRSNGSKHFSPASHYQMAVNSQMIASK